jgi:nicotinamidase-related amidase
MTDICVLSTVVGAFNHEYRISVVEDGVATLWPDIQRATLDIVGRAFGRVVSSKEVLDTISAFRQGAAR